MKVYSPRPIHNELNARLNLKKKKLQNSSKQPPTYNGPVWNKEGSKRSGPTPSKDRGREGRETMHRHSSPPSTSKSIPAFDLANSSPLPWHVVNSSPGPIETRPQPQMPFNAWTAAREAREGWGISYFVLKNSLRFNLKNAFNGKKREYSMRWKFRQFLNS